MDTVPRKVAAVPYTLWLALAALVAFLVVMVWVLKKASKRMYETADIDHKTGTPRWMG